MILLKNTLLNKVTPIISIANTGYNAHKEIKKEHKFYKKQNKKQNLEKIVNYINSITKT